MKKYIAMGLVLIGCSVSGAAFGQDLKVKGAQPVPVSKKEAAPTTKPTNQSKPARTADSSKPKAGKAIPARKEEAVQERTKQN